MSRLTLPLASAILLLVLAPGCARDDRAYPSLAPRAVEALGFAEPETKQPDVSPDPTLDTKIAEQRQSLARVAKGFTAAAAAAEATAGRAKGQAVGTDAWLDAQSRLAELDDWRAQASALVTDTDQMIADRAAALAPIYSPLATLRDEAVAEATRQSQAIARIEAMVRPA